MTEFQEYRTNAHEITDETLFVAGVSAETGKSVELGSFRTDPELGDDNYLAGISFGYGSTEEPGVTEVRVPGKLRVMEEHALQVIKRNRGRIAVAGTILVTFAAGAGLLVKKYKND